MSFMSVVLHNVLTCLFWSGSAYWVSFASSFAVSPTPICWSIRRCPSLTRAGSFGAPSCIMCSKDYLSMYCALTGFRDFWPWPLAPCGSDNI